MLPSGRQMLWGLLIAVPVCAGLLVLAYVRTTIPAVNAYATAQTTVIVADDHSKVIARVGDVTSSGATINRTDVPLSQVPLQLQHAVLAAEDRHFFDEPAVSATGTMRALITDVVGGDITQGGSTITQQYVKNAYLTQQRTLSRKLSEVLIAVKLGQETSKPQILDDYLNTIYFGRGAYGVSAAARAYFRKPLADLTTAQDVLLAEVINDPTGDDPRFDPPDSVSNAQARFTYVVDGMVTEGWLTTEEATAMHLPRTVPISTRGDCVGNNCFIRDAVMAELADMGFSQAQLDQGGYRVITTIDPTAQHAAVAAVRAASHAHQIDEQTGRPEASVVSIKPGDGAIEAMYAGRGCSSRSKSTTRCIDTTGVTHLFDRSALDYGRPPGSSMKPYTLIAALEAGLTLDTVEPGPAETEVDGSIIHNAGDEVCDSPCTLATALAQSINTVFVPLAEAIGPAKVAAVAHAAGIPKSVHLPDAPEITLGTNDVPVVDQADGYATIAADGEQAAPYLVSEVIAPNGQVVARNRPKLTRAFSSDIAADAIAAMQRVLACTPVEGTACGKELDDGERPAAGKTGTATNASDDNSDAWFIGFTPQLSTAVWVGNDKQGSTLSAGGLEIYGGATPAGIWQSMMNAALERQPIEDFPSPTEVITEPSTPTTSKSSTSSPSSSPPATTTSGSQSPSTSPPSTSTAPATSAPTSPPSSSSIPVPPPAGSHKPVLTGTP